MKEGLFYKQNDDKNVFCHLCPHHCRVAPGKYGICRVRKNIDGKLFLMNYGMVTALNLDPIEKKPLYHFKPGRNIFSMGSNGCNLKCACCQNWEIAQTSVEDFPYLKNIAVDEIMERALTKDNIGIAFTYNEPTVWYEFMYDIAVKSKQKGLSNVMVSNGFISSEPLEQLLPFMDAFNIDLKGFTNEFYKKVTKAKLEPVKETLLQLKDAGKHLEITNLLIPGENDNEDIFREMIDWIAEKLGTDQVLHISRYFPNYNMTVEGTSVNELTMFYDIAREKLNYVYLGNVRLDKTQNTYCSKCFKLVINRSGYTTDLSGIDMQGNCIYCRNHIVEM